MSQRKKDRVTRPRKNQAGTEAGKADLMPQWLKTDQALAAGERFQPVDWLAFAITTLIALIGYCLTISPDLTLEDSGELAVASMYAGVPHPQGTRSGRCTRGCSPSWCRSRTSRFAWRCRRNGGGAERPAGVADESGLVEDRREHQLVRRHGRALSQALGRGERLRGRVDAGTSGFMWSYAVIVEVYTLSVLSLMGVLCCLYRWTQDTSRMRYLYWSFFWFGIRLCNHQTLIVAVMGIETAILFAHPRLGRNFFTVNSIVYLVILVLMITDSINLFANNVPMQIMFHLWLSFLLVSGFLWMVTVVKAGEGITPDWREELRDGVKVVWSGLAYAGGAAFYLYMPLASMTNPPLNWGYPRTWDGFLHAFSRGQYAQTNPTTSFEKFIDQIFMYWEGI